MKESELTDEWILSEIEKIKYSFNLTKIIRYELKRKEEIETESVAEHVYNMLILANYFRDLEDPEKKLDFEKVTNMILMHDMGEIETGDISMGKKTEKDLINETLAVLEVAKKTPRFISEKVVELCTEYDQAETLEAKYVKAIDKIEQQFWHGVFCNPKMINSATSLELKRVNEEKRRALYKKFSTPIIAKFGLVIHDYAIKRGMTY